MNRDLKFGFMFTGYRSLTSLSKKSFFHCVFIVQVCSEMWILSVSMIKHLKFIVEDIEIGTIWATFSLRQWMDCSFMHPSCWRWSALKIETVVGCFHISGVEWTVLFLKMFSNTQSLSQAYSATSAYNVRAFASLSRQGGQQDIKIVAA